MQCATLTKTLLMYSFPLFHAISWCRFSNMLAPIWDEGADLISKEMVGQSVLVGKIDCDNQVQQRLNHDTDKFYDIMNSLAGYSVMLD